MLQSRHDHGSTRTRTEARHVHGDWLAPLNSPGNRSRSDGLLVLRRADDGLVSRVLRLRGMLPTEARALRCLRTIAGAVRGDVLRWHGCDGLTASRIVVRLRAVVHFGRGDTVALRKSIGVALQ
jgi:hypothetical protein